MGDHETLEDLKEQLASQARLFEERLSAIEASRENTGGLQAAPEPFCDFFAAWMTCAVQLNHRWPGSKHR